MSDDNAMQKIRWQRAIDAINAHDLSALRALIAEGLDVNARSPVQGASDATLLMMAAWDENNTEMLRTLIELGADVNAQAWCGNSLTRAKGFDNVKLLLEHGADPNIPDSTRKATVLLYQAEDGNAEAVRLLLNAGADITALDSRADSSQNNVFQIALKAGRTEVIDVLLVYLQNWSGSQNINWLSVAIDHGDRTLVNRMLAMDMTGGTGEAAINSALDRGDFELARTLAERSARPSDYMLGQMAEQGSYKGVDFCLKLGVDVNTGDALPRAAAGGHLKIVKRLIKNGADIEKEGGGGGLGQTALHHAAVRGHLKVVKYLLKRGAEVNKISKNNETPLTSVLWERRFEDNLEIVKALLKGGANPALKIPKTDSDGYPYEFDAYALIIAGNNDRDQLTSLFDKYAKDIRRG